jgi:cytochrome c oxidase subunit I
VNSPQAAIDTAMQPLTFALTIVSALSLYSLFFTIYKSSYTWNAAGTALFLGLVSWFSAGLSGVVNATIAFDQVIHNTLWIVGHFHQMALLNVGLVAFAAVYAWLPDWVGHPLYSERLAKVHVWGTFLFATANSVVWLIEGLEGAPRRFAVLPHNYDTLGQVGSGFAIATGVVQLPFFWNVVQTVRGKVAVPREWPDTVGEAVIVLITLGLVFLGSFVGWVIGYNTPHVRTKTVTVGTAATAATTTTAPSTIGGGSVAAGRQVFASAGCSGCRTLKAAGATGTVGPNLDQRKPPLALVLQRVMNGKAAMPSFKSRLTPQQIKDVAAFVVASTSG